MFRQASIQTPSMNSHSHAPLSVVLTIYLHLFNNWGFEVVFIIEIISNIEKEIAIYY